jgi:hypothetical protein
MIKQLHNEYRELSNLSCQRIKHNNSLKNDDIIWENDIYFNPSIRYGHLQYFKSGNDKIEIIHSVFYPSYFKKLPIFGFDVIALNGVITGIFCDFTDSPYGCSELSLSLKKLKERYGPYSRELPPWATFFSDNFICINPKGLDESILIKDFVDIFKKYIFFVANVNFNESYFLIDDIKMSIETQNTYSFNQRKNEKTSKALSAYIGADEAREFMETILFPIY